MDKGTTLMLLGAVVGSLLVLLIVMKMKKASMARKIQEIDRLAEAGSEERLWPERPRGMPYNQNPPLTKEQAKNMRPLKAPKAPPPAPAKRVRHDHYVHDGRVDRTLQPGRSSVPGSSHQPAHTFDPLNPLHPLHPISPFNQVPDEPRETRQRDVDHGSYSPSESSYSSSSDSGSSSSDSGSGGSSSD